MSLIENVKNTIDGMGQVELSGIKLESADVRLLDVGSMDLDKHVAMQPAAIAYYGAMKKEANRRLTYLKRGYDRWKQKQWGMAKAAVLSGTTAQWKPTLADIESRFIADNEPEIERQEKMMDKAQEEVDTLESWYEGWRQKSFALQEHINIDSDERWNSKTSAGEGGEGHNFGGGTGNGYGTKGGQNEGKLLSSDKIQEVRDIMKRRRGTV